MATIEEHDVPYYDDKTIHYLAAGPETGPLILFLHGWPATAITWKFQIDAFAALGFRVVAPDMPGCGQSTARHSFEDYSQEAIVEGMLALLAATGRRAAVWVGHDWGAGVVSSVAAQHPEVVVAAANMCVPYRTVECGWDAFLPLVNRATYPADRFEVGQWDYMKNFEQNFHTTVNWFDRDIAGLLKAGMQPSKGPPPTCVGPLAAVRKEGWFGGMPEPPSVEMTGPPLLPADAFDRLVRDMQRTGFWTPCAYYMNHERNAAYHGKVPGGGKLTCPVLFVHAAWDTTCDTKTFRLAKPMRELCSNLAEVTVEAGHWVQLDKPAEVNAALCRFIIEQVPWEWPGFWDSGYTTRKSGL